MRGVLRVVLINLAVLAVGVVLGELALRTFAPLPVPGGVYLDRSGASVPVAEDALTLRRNIAVTHVSPEFRAPISTNTLGYRTTRNQSPTPDLVFLGDSFTFGHGVADEETFASVACHLTNRACQNLGRSGTSTFEQIDVLRHAIGAGLRPKTVAVTMLSACWFDSAGNDLGDNARYAQQHPGVLVPPAAPPVTSVAEAPPAPALPAAAPPAPAPTEPAAPDTPVAPAAPSLGMVKRLQIAVADVEIVKRTLLLIAAPLKRGAYRCSGEGDAARVMPATGAALRQLETLGRIHGFQTVLFVIHPLQELDGAHRTTEALVRAQLPDGVRAVFTASQFRPEHYFPYDGHFTADGHKVMGELVARNLKAP